MTNYWLQGVFGWTKACKAAVGNWNPTSSPRPGFSPARARARVTMPRLLRPTLPCIFSDTSDSHLIQVTGLVCRIYLTWPSAFVSLLLPHRLTGNIGHVGSHGERTPLHVPISRFGGAQRVEPLAICEGGTSPTAMLPHLRPIRIVRVFTTKNPG